MFSFKGRSNRKEYIVKILITILVFIIGSYTVNECTNNDLLTVVYVMGMAIFVNILIFQYFPLTVRRLHDINENGWYVLLTFLPFCQFFMLWLMFKKGTPGLNKYGKPPTD